MGPAAMLPADLSLDRLASRRSLVEQLEAGRRSFESSDALNSYDRHRQRAYTVLASDQMGAALDVRREPLAVRERFGLTLFGQACLAARRLVEAGSRFVTVFWDEFGLAGSAWDTHDHHFERMKTELCPGFDRGFAGLIEDLSQRGLLDDTLVVCMSEHGRTPQINKASGGGRDHWSRAYSTVLAGGGVVRAHRGQNGPKRGRRAGTSGVAQGYTRYGLPLARHRPRDIAARSLWPAIPPDAHRSASDGSAGVKRAAVCFPPTRAVAMSPLSMAWSA